MTTPWLGHENLCPLQWGQPCTCVEAGESPCLCSPVSGVHPECPLHGDLSETPPEPAWMTTLSGDGDLG